MSRVPIIKLFAPLGESAGFLEPAPDDFDTSSILHPLPIVRGVALAIEIAFADDLRGQAQPSRGLIQNLFDHEHALWAAEAAKSGLRGLMGTADQAGEFGHWEQIGVVAVEHCAR